MGNGGGPMNRCSDCVWVLMNWPLFKDAPICTHPENEDKTGMWSDCKDEDAEKCPYFVKREVDR